MLVAGSVLGASVKVGGETAATPLKIYIYDLPQWKDPSKFGDTSKHADIRRAQGRASCPDDDQMSPSCMALSDLTHVDLHDGVQGF